MSLQDTLNAANKVMGKSAKYVLREGKNRFRVLTEPLAYHSEFKGNITTKFICWVIDRQDDEIKLFYMPYGIFAPLVEMQNGDFGWSEFPMPYDVIASVENPGTINAKYIGLQPTKPSELSKIEQQTFEEQKPIDQVLEKLEKRQGGMQIQPEPEPETGDDSWPGDEPQ